MAKWQVAHSVPCWHHWQRGAVVRGRSGDRASMADDDSSSEDVRPPHHDTDSPAPGQPLEATALWPGRSCETRSNLCVQGLFGFMEAEVEEGENIGERTAALRSLVRARAT